MNSIRAWLLFLLSTCVVLADEPDDSRINSLIVQLDADEAGDREKAATELERVGGPALPALRKAAADGSAERRGRAASLIVAIQRNEILGRPGNRALKELLAANLRGKSHRIAIHDWIIEENRGSNLVETALDLLSFPGEGPEARIGLEALNQLMAPRGLIALSRTPEMDATSGQFKFLESRNALEQVQALLEGLHAEISAEAAKKLAAFAGLPRDRSELFPSRLNCISSICDECNVVLRAGDDGTIAVEMMPEAISNWRDRWKSVKGDSLLRVDLGLDVPPVVTEDSLDEWMERLDDPDPRNARIARTVLRQLPDALVPLFETRAITVSECEMLELLRQRHKGTILFSTGDSLGEALWVTRADGSSPRRISGNLHEIHEPLVSSDGAVIYATVGPVKGPKAVVALQTDGLRPPTVIHAEAALSIGGIQRPPWLILRRGERSFAWNADTSSTGTLPTDSLWSFGWSPDGQLACAGPDGDSFAIWIGSPAQTFKKLCTVSSDAADISWSRDSSMILCSTRARGPTPGELLLIDVNPGTCRVICGLPADADAPEWSPVGPWFAYSKGFAKGTWVRDAQSGAEKHFDKDPVPCFSKSSCWSRDGKKLCLFGSPGNGPGIWVLDHGTSEIHRVRYGTYFAQWAFGSDWFIRHGDTGLILVSSDGEGRIIRVTDAIEDLGVHLKLIPAAK